MNARCNDTQRLTPLKIRDGIRCRHADSTRPKRRTSTVIELSTPFLFPGYLLSHQSVTTDAANMLISQFWRQKMPATFRRMSPASCAP